MLKMILKIVESEKDRLARLREERIESIVLRRIHSPNAPSVVNLADRQTILRKHNFRAKK